MQNNFEIKKKINNINKMDLKLLEKLIQINESSLHINVNQNGWTVRHVVCFFISINIIIRKIIDELNKEPVQSFLDSEIRKQIGMEMATLFAQRKNNLSQYLKKYSNFSIEETNNIIAKKNSMVIRNEQGEEVLNLENFLFLNEKKMSKLLEQLNSSKKLGYLN